MYKHDYRHTPINLTYLSRCFRQVINILNKIWIPFQPHCEVNENISFVLTWQLTTSRRRAQKNSCNIYLNFISYGVCISCFFSFESVWMTTASFFSISFSRYSKTSLILQQYSVSTHNHITSKRKLLGTKRGEVVRGLVYINSYQALTTQ